MFEFQVRLMRGAERAPNADIPVERDLQVQVGRRLPAVVQPNLRARSKGRCKAGSIALSGHLRRLVRQDLVVGALPRWYGFELGQRPVLVCLGPPQIPQFAELFGMPAS